MKNLKIALLKIALAQANFTVGDITGNTKKILQYINKAAKADVDLIVFSEMAITGYPAEDLTLKPSFQKAATKALVEIVKKTKKLSIGIIMGGIEVKGSKVYNAAFLIEKGKVTVQHKYSLPNYGEFDEKRLFAHGKLPKPIMFRGVKLGIFICEDMWGNDVPKALKNSEILISINGSPFEIAKHKKRKATVKRVMKLSSKPLVYVNQVCGQDELVFDGSSFVINHDQEIALKLPAFKEGFAVSNWKKQNGKWYCEKGKIHKTLTREGAIYKAMVLGLRDYVKKSKFSGVVIGLSGGIDSALSAAVAVDALGAKKVHGVLMPSRYTSKASIDDAKALAKNLGISLQEISIEPAFKTFKEDLKSAFKDKKEDKTEENLQARIRGILLMSLSNKFGWMLLTTGNKSEMSVGYSTLYGDMCGGYSVLKDLYKTEVYKLSRWRNKNKPEIALGKKGLVIPQNVLTKTPSAELKYNQTDQDTLPPYDELDDILYQLIELEKPLKDIVKSGHKLKLVEKISKMLTGAEYKRRQAPPGIKITAKSFGRDRRYPITNKFSD